MQWRIAIRDRGGGSSKPTMSSDHTEENLLRAGEGSASLGTSPPRTVEKQKEKSQVSRTSLILWHTHQNDVAAVRKLLDEDPGLVNARDYDSRTPLHVAALHGWVDAAKCLLEHGANVNAQDRWKNTGSFGEIIKAHWRGTPVAVKRILPSLSDDRLGDLHQYLKEKGALSPSVAINFALDIARGMAHLHNEPNVVIHRDLKPRNVLSVNSSADHLKVGDFGLSKLIKAQNAHDVYRLTGETGSYRYIVPEVFKHRKYDKKVDVFSFAMILYEMLEGDPPFLIYEPYEAAKIVAQGNRPVFRAKGYIQELRDLTEHCWAGDMNRRPSFLDILKRLEKLKESHS